MQHSALPPVEQITDQLLDFMERRIYPNEARYQTALHPEILGDHGCP